MSESDIAAVVEALRGDWLTGGPTVAAFEEAVAAQVGARYAVAFSSGTAGLHAAVVTSGLGSGDLVATPSLTFAASANCVLLAGGQVTFVDIEEHTLNLDPAAVPADVSALIAVHYAGLPVDFSRLRHRPRIVIEDAAQALGATTEDGPVGCCSRSDACVFSFHPVKSITSAEGGMVTTNDPLLADRLRRFRNHGIDRTKAAEPWGYRIEEAGYNYRLSDLHAALGLSQLSRLGEFIGRRSALADRYDRLLSTLPVQLPPGVDGAPSTTTHARHLYPIRVAGRAAVYERLHDLGIGVQVHFVPLHHQPRFAGEAPPYLPETDRAYEGLLSLPLYPTLSDTDQDRVVTALAKCL